VGGRGETPPKHKIVEKLKSNQNTWIFIFILKCSIYSRIDLFLKNIAKNLQPGLHNGHLNKQNLQGVSWRTFNTNWQNKMLKIVNRGQGETTRQKK